MGQEYKKMATVLSYKLPAHGSTCPTEVMSYILFRAVLNPILLERPVNLWGHGVTFFDRPRPRYHPCNNNTYFLL